jgi:hypothetical protein
MLRERSAGSASAPRQADGVGARDDRRLKRDRAVHLGCITAQLGTQGLQQRQHRLVTTASISTPKTLGT